MSEIQKQSSLNLVLSGVGEFVVVRLLTPFATGFGLGLTGILAASISRKFGVLLTWRRESPVIKS